MPILQLDSYVTPSLQQLWDLPFKFTFTGFSSPQPPSPTGWCPWTRKLLSVTKHLVNPTQPSIRGLQNSSCQSAAPSQAAGFKLWPSCTWRAKGWLWNTSAKAQVFTIKDRSEFCSMCLWKFQSSTSCYETPWLETQAADLLCTHYMLHWRKIFAELVLSPYRLII